MTVTAPVRFARRTEAGIADPHLKQAMARAEEGIFGHSRAAMLHPQFQDWREAGARTKDAVLANLDTHLERFEEQATAAGAQVHWAVDAAAARQLVVDIAHQHGLVTAIKSKSMLCEEIGLNAGLAADGVDVLETDLGEYVVQLAAGRPSHIIAPIIHMTHDQVNEVFARHHGPRPRTTREEVVAEARALLRPRMMAAEMGITGANFLVAATGSVALVTNEGNGRYCTTAPQVRVTLAGIEKVLPSMAELALMLRLLPRAATGQQTSTYVSIATGASATSRPHHHHIILVDNGRSAMLAGRFRPMLRCIRCGACMNHCPVYKVAGGLSYDSVYTGPMGAVLSPNLFGPRHDELPHAATMCGACSVACPVKIPLPDLMRGLREEQVAAHRRPWFENLAFAVWAFAAHRPRLYRMLARCGGAALRLARRKDGTVRRLPGGGGWFRERDLVAPPPGTVRFDPTPEKRA